MSRADEIAQGLREPGGALIGGLNVADYIQGRQDFAAGNQPPQLASASYDLGRARAAQEAEAAEDFAQQMRRDQLAARGRVRDLLVNRPDLLAEFDAKMRDLDA